MTRVISVFLPTLSTDRVRRKAADTAPPPETPLILVGRDGRRRVVLAADGRHAGRNRVSAYDGGHYDYLPALLQSAVLRSPVLAG